MNEVKEHTRNQKRMYRIHKLEEKVHNQDLLVGSLRQENQQLKDKIEKAFKIVDDKLTNLNLEYGVNNEFREEYDELYELLKGEENE